MNPEGQQDYWQHDSEDRADMLLQNTPPEPPSTSVAHASEPGEASISWQASEYVHHEKHALWFAALIGGGLVLMAIAYFLIHSPTFTLLIVVMVVAVIVIASRPPRVLRYRLDYHGLMIDDRRFDLHDFRAFGIVQDGPFYSITLIPHKRFMPAVNVYFPPEEGEKIVDIFGTVLPMEHAEPDILDRLARKLRF